MRTAATEKVDALCAATGLPRRYATRTWTDVRELGDTAARRAEYGAALRTIHAYRDELENYVHAGRGLYLCGSLGTGKSLLLTLLGLAALDLFRTADRGRGPAAPRNRVRFVLASHLTDLVYPAREPGPDRELRRELEEVEFLLLDDLGKLAESRMGGELVYLDRVLRTRYHRGLATCYSAQPDPEALCKLYRTPALADLLAETTETVRLVAPSARRPS